MGKIVCPTAKKNVFVSAVCALCTVICNVMKSVSFWMDVMRVYFSIEKFSHYTQRKAHAQEQYALFE